MDDNSILESKIEQLKERLEDMEDVDPLYMGPDLQYLRHKVLFTHARLELSLDYLIVKGLTNHLIHKTTKLEDMFTYRKAQKILGEISFAKKLELAKKLYQIKNPLYNKIRSVNKIRNKLSHAITNQDEIYKLKEPQKYIEVLETIVLTMDQMNKLFAKFVQPKKQ